MSEIRKALEARVTPELHPINLDPYPGTVGEVADEIASFVLELEQAGIANGLAGLVLDALADRLGYRVEGVGE